MTREKMKENFKIWLERNSQRPNVLIEAMLNHEITYSF